ncbi:MAG: sulfotransferase domain-containing protein [Acidobacteriota bacterium]
MTGIVWLASYPKSGNTWLRAFLMNFLDPGKRPVDINQLGAGGLVNSRERFDLLTGVESSDLGPDEIARLRPEVNRLLCTAFAELEDVTFSKVHDAFTRSPEYGPFFPSTGRAVYVIRNPLDVALSFSYFMARSLDRTIRMMANEHMTLGAKWGRMPPQLPQRLRSWSGHVKSWLEESDMPVEVLRFEDMKAAPFETFSRAVRFVGLEPEPHRIRRAVKFSSFQELKRQERSHGFRERGRGEVFFRRGEVGSWKDELTRDQVRRIVSDHEEVMSRFGYLTPSVLQAAASKSIVSA